jgi:hypothetical protein
VSKEVRKAITGHATIHVHDEYGSEFPVKMLAEALAKVSYQ